MKKVEEIPVRAWRVEVRREHINAGVCGNPKRCAVSQAIAELAGMDCVKVKLLPAQGSFRVRRAVAMFDFRGVTHCVGLPPEVARFISDFDLAKPVQPFVFEMSLDFAVAPEAA